MNYILAHQGEFVKPTDIKIALTLLGEGRVRPPTAFTGFVSRFIAAKLIVNPS